VLGLHPPDLASPGGCESCGGSCGYCPGPGRHVCDCCCDGQGPCGRFFCGFYHCVCCPDPCYEGHWTALADTAFFQDAPRPITQLRLRYEHGWDMTFPDKSEFFWARSDGSGKGPRPFRQIIGDNELSYRRLVMVNEVAAAMGSVAIETPYEQVSPENFHGVSGFGDLAIKAKALLLDCELMQFATEFNTFIPIGNFTRGLGTGHVSLEPAGLLAVKVTEETYLQAELAYRIPIGGDQAFQGPVLHYHLALNQTLWRCGHDLQLLGTAELNGWEFCGGGFTAGLIGAPNGVQQVGVGSQGDVVTAGPGVRFVICDKIDIGASFAFGLTRGSVADDFLQVEFRWRF
jgi:hypothetical protein